jgi:RimJ/RimL family protein N-acetyltransferase
MGAQPQVEAGPVSLPSGERIAIRPIAPGDEPLVESLYERMSPESRRRRFLVAPPRLSEEDLQRLTHVDHRRHDAMLALDPASGLAVGEARYVRVPGDSETAEVAAMVADDWQRRGVATALLAQLTDRARTNGVRRYTAVVAVDNEPVLQALEREGARRTATENDEAELVLDLPSEGMPERLEAALRWAGSRQLTLLGRLARWVAALPQR